MREFLESASGASRRRRDARSKTRDADASLEVSRDAGRLEPRRRRRTSALAKRLRRNARASANATRWRVGLRPRAKVRKGANGARAVSERAARAAGAVASTWLDGAGVTIATGRRDGTRRRASERGILALRAEMRAMRDEFWENHPTNFTVEPAAAERGTESASEPPKRDEFVQWMIRAKELAPGVFDRDLSFAREFSKDGAPFALAIRLIDEWTATNTRRFEERFPRSTRFSSSTGEPPRNVERITIDALKTYRNDETAFESDAEENDVQLNSHPTFEPDPFPVLPLEILPVQHFVLGLWGKLQPTTTSIDEVTKKDSQTAPSSPQTPISAVTTPAPMTPNQSKEVFSLPWLDSAWIDLLSPASTPRKKRARVWRGKNLDMIVYGSDEKNTWALKIGAFLKRARSALGNRVLNPTAWGGSIIDSLIGANLTQNVSDVLSSTAFMNLAARFPYNASTARRHDDSVYIHRVVREMFDRICSNQAPLKCKETIKENSVDSPIEEAQPFETPTRQRRVPRKSYAPKSKGKSKWTSGAFDSVLSLSDPEQCKRTTDQVDWYAVLDAPLVEVVKCIRCRGMHWMLARRIKGILNRIMKQRGCLSLEFLRDAPTKEAREYLLALDGMGVKTTSCVLLLALHRSDFPVDVNVGRIMARLGWVPLESETALEELAQYAPEPAVYTFLRERLNSFGVDMLYELHYHMITLGKVFCGKRMPNCGACPLRDMCEYAKQGGKCLDRPDGHTGLASLQPQKPIHGPRSAIDIEDITQRGSHTSTVHNNVNAGDSAHVLQAVISAGLEWDRHGRPSGLLATNVLLLSGAMSRDEVQLAYIRLSRVVHPDKNSHPDAPKAFNYITEARQVELSIATGEDYSAKNIEAELDEMIRMSAEDYELSLEDVTGMELTETVVRASKVRAETVGWLVPTSLLPNELITALGSDTASNGCIMIPINSGMKSLDEIKEATVSVAILVPCASAMREKFPLHGTYFQTNEMFLDETSSTLPMRVLKSELTACRRMRVLVGTSIGSITRGMGRAQVTTAFASQRICVRAWNRVTKRPGPLPRWLCPFYPQQTTRPLEPEPAPLSKNGRPLGGALPLAPMSQVLSPIIAQSSKLAGLAQAAPKDSVEHKLLEEFQRLFKGHAKPKMSAALKRAYSGAPYDPDRKRRKLFPSVGRGQKCGFCNNCLNPRFKQACITRRNEMRMASMIA